MKLKDTLHLPTLAELGEFGRSEFANGVSDIRSALIDEAWFGRSTASPGHTDHPSLGWDLPEDAKAERSADQVFREAWSTDRSDLQRPDRDQAQELDFDR
jgi:hypothetical protein